MANSPLVFKGRSGKSGESKFLGRSGKSGEKFSKNSRNRSKTSKKPSELRVSINSFRILTSSLTSDYLGYFYGLGFLFHDDWTTIIIDREAQETFSY